MAVLDAAVEAGVTFLNTADLYRDGRSETLIGRFLAQRSDAAEYLTVATKMGRRADPHVPQAYTLAAFRDGTDRSRRKLGVDTLDVVQLHCPPTEVPSQDAVFDALDTLVDEARIAGARALGWRSELEEQGRRVPPLAGRVTGALGAGSKSGRAWPRIARSQPCSPRTTRWHSG